MIRRLRDVVLIDAAVLYGWQAAVLGARWWLVRRSRPQTDVQLRATWHTNARTVLAVINDL